MLVVVRNPDKGVAKGWRRPKSIARMRVTDDLTIPRLETRATPHCYGCHSNTHVFDACPWKTLAGLEIDTSLGDKKNKYNK